MATRAPVARTLAHTMHFRDIVKMLYDRAIQQENVIADLYMRELKKSKDEEIQKLLRTYTNKQDFLRNFFKYLTRGKVNGKLKTSEKGQFRIYDKQYTINGKEYTLSPEREEEIRRLFKQNGEWTMEDRQLRLSGLVFEEAGERLLSNNLDKLGIKVGSESGIFNVEMSKDFKADTQQLLLTFYTEEEMKEYNRDKHDYMFDTARYMYWDHKNSLESFHIGTSNVEVDYTNRLANIDGESVSGIDLGIPMYEVLSSTVLLERLSILPVYYSILSHQVLLTSDVLSNPDEFFLKKPKFFTKTELDRMAREMVLAKMNGASEEEIAAMRYRRLNWFDKDFWEDKPNIKFSTTTELWYGKR